jgi:hypothetical protein
MVAALFSFGFSQQPHLCTTVTSEQLGLRPAPPRHLLFILGPTVAAHIVSVFIGVKGLPIWCAS